MSTAAFPTLKPNTWPVIREASWHSNVPVSISGKVYPVSYWSQPKWKWTLTYSGLRGYTTALAAAEILSMQDFFDVLKGRGDSFLYTDANDNGSSGATIGTGDSTNKLFQLQRTLKSFYENILAPTAVTAVYVGSSAISSTKWTYSSWQVGGTTAPGIVTFSTFGPTTGQAVTADFTYAWPVLFDQDIMTFEEFVRKIWALKTVSFTSIR